MAKRKQTRKSSSIIERRIERQKKELVEALERFPIIYIALKKVGISKATYYRWRDDDAMFEAHVGEALSEGSKIINDLAESKLFEKIKEGDLKAATFWLKYRDQRYTERRSLEAHHFKAMETKSISEEQAELIFRTMSNFNKKLGDLKKNPRNFNPHKDIN